MKDSKRKIVITLYFKKAANLRPYNPSFSDFLEMNNSINNQLIAGMIWPMGKTKEFSSSPEEEDQLVFPSSFSNRLPKGFNILKDGDYNKGKDYSIETVDCYKLYFPI